MSAARVEHTPGPWAVLAGEFKGKGIVAYEIRMPEAILSKSNADLIAAAPDMLAALKALIDCDPFDCDAPTGTSDKMDAALAMAHAAIAKAEGGQ